MLVKMLVGYVYIGAAFIRDCVIEKVNTTLGPNDVMSNVYTHSFLLLTRNAFSQEVVNMACKSSKIEKLKVFFYTNYFDIIVF